MTEDDCIMPPVLPTDMKPSLVLMPPVLPTDMKPSLVLEILPVAPLRSAQC